MSAAAPVSRETNVALRLTQVRASGKGARVGPLTFDLREGVSAIVADRGDGADLLLAVLAGEVRSSGSIIPPKPHRIAYVSSPVPLPDELTASEYLQIASSFRGCARNDAATLARFSLDAWAGVRIANIPEPERKALAIAEACTSDASLVLLDTPFAGITIAAAAAIEHALREPLPGRTCVFSTPSTDVAARLASSIIVFQNGQVMALGSPNDAFLGTGRYRIECSDPGKLYSLLRKSAGEALYLEVSGRMLHAERSVDSTAAHTNDGSSQAPPLDIAKLVTLAAAEANIDIVSMGRERALPEVVRARLAAQLGNGRRP
ncbi:MAG: hypothetical protein U0174_11675 [Polyangiaceae bacterium]